MKGGPSEPRDLVAAARRARAHAHAPYSRFRVGAAVLDERGRVHVGCNVENASYGLTVCAERNAVAAAVAAGARRLVAVAIVTDADPPGTPCGACRQVLAEFTADDTPIVLAASRGIAVATHTLGELIPHAFRLRGTGRRR
jgi:cytidine deaminase